MIDFTIDNKKESSFKLNIKCSQLKKKYQTYGKNFLTDVFTSKETNKLYLKEAPNDDDIDEQSKQVELEFVLPTPDDKLK